MKLYYFNDERNPVRVRIMDSRFDPVTFTGDFYFDLGPAQGCTYEVFVPEDAILYVKKWPGLVMLSTMDVSSLEHLGEILPRRPRQEQQEEGA